MSSYQTEWRLTKSTELDDNGSGTISFADPSHSYLIEQISVQVDNGIGGVCIVEINNAFICGTASGALDSADGLPAIILRAGETLTVTWANVSTGTAAHVTYIGKVTVYQ